MGLSVENAQSFFIARRRESNLVLLDDVDGIPMLVEQSVVLLRAEYVLGEDASDDRLFQPRKIRDSFLTKNRGYMPRFKLMGGCGLT